MSAQQTNLAFGAGPTRDASAGEIFCGNVLAEILWIKIGRILANVLAEKNLLKIFKVEERFFLEVGKEVRFFV